MSQWPGLKHNHKQDLEPLPESKEDPATSETQRFITPPSPAGHDYGGADAWFEPEDVLVMGKEAVELGMHRPPPKQKGDMDMLEAGVEARSYDMHCAFGEQRRQRLLEERQMALRAKLYTEHLQSNVRVRKMIGNVSGKEHEFVQDPKAPTILPPEVTSWRNPRPRACHPEAEGRPPVLPLWMRGLPEPRPKKLPLYSSPIFGSSSLSRSTETLLLQMRESSIKGVNNALEVAVARRRSSAYNVGPKVHTWRQSGEPSLQEKGPRAYIPKTYFYDLQMKQAVLGQDCGWPQMGLQYGFAPAGHRAGYSKHFEQSEHGSWGPLRHTQGSSIPRTGGGVTHSSLIFFNSRDKPHHNHVARPLHWWGNPHAHPPEPSLPGLSQPPGSGHAYASMRKFSKSGPLPTRERASLHDMLASEESALERRRHMMSAAEAMKARGALQFSGEHMGGSKVQQTVLTQVRSGTEVEGLEPLGMEVKRLPGKEFDGSPHGGWQPKVIADGEGSVMGKGTAVSQMVAGQGGRGSRQQGCDGHVGNGQGGGGAQDRVVSPRGVLQKGLSGAVLAGRERGGAGGEAEVEEEGPDAARPGTPTQSGKEGAELGDVVAGSEGEGSEKGVGGGCGLEKQTCAENDASTGGSGGDLDADMGVVACVAARAAARAAGAGDESNTGPAWWAQAAAADAAAWAQVEQVTVAAWEAALEAESLRPWSRHPPLCTTGPLDRNSASHCQGQHAVDCELEAFLADGHGPILCNVQGLGPVSLPHGAGTSHVAAQPSAQQPPPPFSYHGSPGPIDSSVHSGLSFQASSSTSGSHSHTLPSIQCPMGTPSARPPAHAAQVPVPTSGPTKHQGSVQSAVPIELLSSGESCSEGSGLHKHHSVVGRGGGPSNGLKSCVRSSTAGVSRSSVQDHGHIGKAEDACAGTAKSSTGSSRRVTPGSCMQAHSRKSFDTCASAAGAPGVPLASPAPTSSPHSPSSHNEVGLQEGPLISIADIDVLQQVPAIHAKCSVPVCLTLPTCVPLPHGV